MVRANKSSRRDTASLSSTFTGPRGASIRSRLASTFSRTSRSGNASKRLPGRPTWRKPGSSRVTKIAELLADVRCSQAVLDIPATTDVGRMAGPTVAEEGEGVASEASEWERGNARSSSHY